MKVNEQLNQSTPETPNAVVRIYFHRPRQIRADEWMCSEMESPWSGSGRGLVLQRIWSKDGTLLASCVQEVSLPFVLPLPPPPFILP